MADFGVIETGFKLKTFNDIKNDIEKRWQVRLEDNNYKLDFNTAEGIFSEAIAYELKMMWEQLLELNSQMSIDTASGVFLDYLGTLLNVNRNAGSYATGQITIESESIIVVPAGVVFKYGELEYELLSSVSVNFGKNDKYYGTGYIQAIEYGTEYNITDTVEFKTDWNKNIKATNDTTIIGGDDSELDSSYRIRLKKVKSIDSVATHQAIYDGLMELDSVENVLILDPETIPATENGTMKIFIEGVPDDEIFDTILYLKADGILTLKDENAISRTKKAKTDDGFYRTLTYNIIQYTPLYIKVVILSTKNEEEKDIRWTNEIKSEIIKYINNLNVGESVSYIKTYSEVLGIDDIRKIQLFMGETKDNLQEYSFEKTFEVPIGKRFRISESNIEVQYE